MAKGGYQKRRIAQKKADEKRARKRAQRRRKFLTALVVLGVLALGAGVTVIAINAGGDEGSLASSPTPTPSYPPGCEPAMRKPTPSPQFEKPPAMRIDKAKTYTATFDTNCGVVKVRLLDNAAPKTVNSFVFLAREGFYDGTIFHRVIPDFGGAGSNMVQGGDGQNFNGTGGPGYEFGDENTIPLTKPGYLAMANSGPGTNGSQFFFLDGTVSHLNVKGSCPGQGCHSVFGKVVDGLEVLNIIAHFPKDPLDQTNSKPLPDVVLEEVTIEETG